MARDCYSRLPLDSTLSSVARLRQSSITAPKQYSPDVNIYSLILKSLLFKYNGNIWRSSFGTDMAATLNNYTIKGQPIPLDRKLAPCSETDSYLTLPKRCQSA